MIGTALFLLCATAIAHAESDDSEVDDFYENGCPKDTTISKLLPDEDCTQYFECVHGELLRRVCSHGLHFNADLEKCDWYGNADCHNKRFEDNNTAPEELDKSNPNHAPLICSTPDSKGVLVAHKHCNEFYKCLNGRPVVLKCAEGLLFSTESEKCDSPVDCGERVLADKKGQTITPTTSKEIEYSMLSIEENDNVNSEVNNTIPVCLSKLSEGVEIPHDSCDKYYKCTGGIAVTIKCPINHLYNPIKEFCDWSQNVDCDGRTISENNDTKPTTEKNNDYDENDISDDDEELSVANMICAAENSAGVLVSHSICNHFYKCIEKKPVAFYCPGDLLFNSIKNYCDWPANVRCGSRTKPVDNETEDKIIDARQAYIICSAKDSDDVLIPHQYCNKFYKCHDEVPVVVKCPGILFYNTKTENCDWPTHVHCKDRIVPENGYSRKEEDENDEDSGSENADESNVGSVSDYYYAHQISLDGESRYRVVKDVNSEDNIIYSNAVRTCGDVNSEGKTLPHENCNQYYKCIEGKAMAFFCDLNLFYQPKKAFCEIDNYVNCSSRIVPENNNNNSDKSNNYADPSCMGKADGAVGSSEICNQFYKCVNGRPYTMYCPPGLLFNDIRNSCDWPTNVDCGKRITEARMINKREVKIGYLGVLL